MSDDFFPTSIVMTDAPGEVVERAIDVLKEQLKTAQGVFCVLFDVTEEGLVTYQPFSWGRVSPHNMAYGVSCAYADVFYSILQQFEDEGLNPHTGLPEDES